ncbi:NADP-dependent oxidoreductase [Microbacterium hominis]|nr:NADP-dependent oxidoreductase [Microbacterium hominis]
MRVIAVSRFGGPGSLNLLDIPQPVPGDGDVRVRIAARAVNPIDVLLRSGALSSFVPARNFYIPGFDFAGTVSAVGAGVTSVDAGARVIGISPWFVTQAGSYADEVVVPADAVAPAPTTADAVDAATLPLNGVTAWLAVDAVDAKPGATIVVTGAAGGVGGFAVQLAAARGATVIGVAAPGDAPLLGSLGATATVPRNVDLAPEIARIAPDGVDAVIDAASLGRIDLVRDGGRFAAVLGPAAPVPERGVAVETVQHTPDGALLGRLSAAVDAGAVTLRVARILPLDQAARGHELYEAGGVRGRIVLAD